MSKIAVNNEIVLMRQAVRQSRVRVVRKLIKEAKLLRARKNKDEKIREKCRRKADRLLAEVTALKKIKDDEISKFGIGETRNLQDILADSLTDPNIRIMAKVAFHKILNDRISKFKEKFPNYEEHLGPGRKKLSKLQRKNTRDTKNEIKKTEGPSDVAENIQKEDKTETMDKESSEEENNNSNTSDVPTDSDDAEIVEEDEGNGRLVENERSNKISKPGDIPRIISKPGDILRIKKAKPSVEKRNKNTQCEEDDKEKSKIMENGKKSKKSESIGSQLKKSIPIKVISEEATVKRFTDLIEDKESAEIVKQSASNKNRKKNEIKLEKQVDSFFMTENGDSEYMSIVVPKSKHTEEEEQDNGFGNDSKGSRGKRFREKNDRFFSKIDHRSSKSNFSNAGEPPQKFSRSGRNFMGNEKKFKPEFENKIAAQEEELHPSWAARKKQQEILKQGFQGKKIVFDD